MYDTHTHLNFQAFKDDYPKIIKQSLATGIFLNIVGSEYLTSKRACEICHEFESDPVYATVGLHPSHLDKNDAAHKWDYDKYKKLASDPKVVAIGETGIDYYRGADNKDDQHALFLEHVRLSRELNKPLIIHCRPSADTFDAYDDLYEILVSPLLTKEGMGEVRAVLHCFLTDLTHAQKFLDLGFYISFTGIITYKNAADYLINTVRQIPLDRILIETDCPYLTPEPLRLARRSLSEGGGQKRNEPLNVKFVAQKIAEIKGIGEEEVIMETKENGQKLFL